MIHGSGALALTEPLFGPTPRPCTLAHWQNGAPLASFAYAPLGRVTETAFASGASNAYTYSPITRISR